MSAPTTPSKAYNGDHPLLDAIRREDSIPKSMNQSYDDLMQALDKNISSASLNIANDGDEDTEGQGDSTYNISEDVQPLNVKYAHLDTSQVLTDDLLNGDDEDSLMEDIPRVPSFDVLEYNTQLNRTSSLSRVSGPRKLTRNLSLKMTPSTSLKNVDTRDNSPSKKSVVFESSPPKVMEYDQLTPDNSFDEEDMEQDTFNSAWNPKAKQDFSKLVPPSPPKHLVLTTSPEKDTSMASSEDISFNLTREDLTSTSMTVEQRLDLFLDNDELNQRNYEDELNRSVLPSPTKSITKEEEELLFKIRSKKDIQEEQALMTAADLFEQDLRNNDKKQANRLQLDPKLKRKGSNNSLKDEERELRTVSVSSNNNSLNDVSDSTLDSFAPATDIMDAATEQEYERSINHGLPSDPKSFNSSSALQSQYFGDKSEESVIGSLKEAHAEWENSEESSIPPASERANTSEDTTPESPLKSSFQSPIIGSEDVSADSTQPLEEATIDEDLLNSTNLLDNSDDKIQHSFAQDFKEASLLNHLSYDTTSESQEHAKEKQIENSDILSELNEIPAIEQVSQGEISSQSIVPKSLDPSKQQCHAFDNELFTDKEPEDIIKKKKSIDFISIWHEKPIQLPQPQERQYSVKARKPTPPKRIMKLIKSFHDQEYGTDNQFEKEEEDGDSEEEDNSNISFSSMTYTKEDLFRRSSLVTTSASRSSVINLTKRNSLLFQHPALDEDDNSSFIHHSLIEDGDLLPDISASSDFASGFMDWEVDSTETHPTKIPRNLQKDLEQYKDIWNISRESPTQIIPKQPSSIRGERLKQIVNHAAANYNESIHMKDVRSSNSPDIEVNDVEDYGVDISFEGSSLIDYNTTVIRRASEDLTNVKLTSIKETPLKRFSLDIPSIAKLRNHDNHVQFKDAEEESEESKESLKSPIKMRAVSSKSNRIMSTSSLATGFNLDDDFEKTFKDDVKYIPVDYQKPAVEREKLALQRQQEEEEAQKRERALLAPMVDQQDMPATPESEKTTTAKSVSQLDIAKKRTEALSSPVKKKLPEFSDHGRLYMHVHSLDSIALEDVPQHKGKFSLSIDNCTHITETPLIDLESAKTNKIDKEFEIVLQEDITELYFNLKVKYDRHENELVEKLERVPIKSPGKISRLFGAKPKYRVEKVFVTQKRTADKWDNVFSEDGTFGKNKIEFNLNETAIKGKKETYIIELFNDWRKDKHGNTIPLSLVGKLNVTLLYIPRTSKLETLPPSIKIAESVAQHWLEQSLITHEGYLHQEGGDCLMWKRRFFKLRGTELIGLNEELKPRLKINLHNVKFIFYRGKKFKSNSRILTDEFLINDSFKLVFYNDEVLNFKADLKSNQMKWIESLEKVIDLNRFNQPWVKLISENL